MASVARNSPKKTLLNPREMRRLREVEVDLGDGRFVRARKEDMTALVMEGRLPMPVLTAVQKMIDMPGATNAERVESLGQSGRALLDIVREHATRVVLEPVVTAADDGNPDHLPVTYLSMAQLLAVWTATALVPEVTAEQAAEFREPAGPRLVAAVADGEGVSAGAEPVVAATEFEFIGQ